MEKQNLEQIFGIVKMVVVVLQMFYQVYIFYYYNLINLYIHIHINVNDNIILVGGDVFEKAGVNLAVVFGKMPQSALRAATERGFDRAKIAAAADKALSSSPSSSSDSNSNSNTFLPSSSTSTSDDIPFFACGISSVIHPKNPHCPTMHFNYRYFETAGGVWWFGGGTDITPAYLDEEDMRHFHGVYKAICDKHDKQFYPKFKKWADEYYFIPHRGETRGLGGIFYDDLNDRDPNLLLDFARDGKFILLTFIYSN